MEKDAPPRRGLNFDEITHLLGYVRPWRGRFLVAVLALLVSMLFGLLFPLLVGYLVDAAIPSLVPVTADAWKPTVNTVAILLVATLAIQSALTFY